MNILTSFGVKPKQMKKLSIILSLIVLTISCKGNENKSSDSLSVKSDKQENKLKRYEVKSGIIQYKSTISGKVMGSVITGSGTESVYFKDWGALELLEEKSTQTTKTNIFGQKSTQTTNTHTMSKLDNGESYHVNFDKKQITLRRDMAMDMTKAFHPNEDAGDVGKNMLESIGGKKIRDEKFLGYNCEVWDVMGAKQWMYKGTVLKLEVTLMGITTIKEATSAKFNVSVSDKYFKLPDFPIQKEAGFRDNDEFEEDINEMNAAMDKLEKMSFEEWKKVAMAEDEEMKQMSDEELHQNYDMIQKMIKMRKGK